ncbi:MAG: type II toxin-antitoxin system Phd/YefM family antitoxin [Lachnospiraceae bacterium]|nr:type II toxin-antitoxin system Phd/YefM family antitoxin [Lachnospiraceae bacterium]
MLAEKTNDYSNYFDLACEGGEPIVVPWNGNNMVIIPEYKYNELVKARNNLEYLEKLKLSDWQKRHGKVIVKTIEELEAMAE